MFPMAPEGRIFVIGTAWMAVLTILFGYTPAGAFLVSLAFALVLVFRRFSPRPSPKINGLVAPVDAVVESISSDADPFSGAPAQRITLRQNRLGEFHLFSPVAAKVEQRRAPTGRPPRATVAAASSPSGVPGPTTPGSTTPGSTTPGSTTPGSTTTEPTATGQAQPSPLVSSSAASPSAVPNAEHDDAIIPVGSLAPSGFFWSLRTPEGVALSLGYEPRGLNFLRVNVVNGDSLQRAQRMGFAGFGGRVHVWLPVGADTLVRPGQRLRAGTDLLGGLAEVAGSNSR